jgi:hypothetical protein
MLIILGTRVFGSSEIEPLQIDATAFQFEVSSAADFCQMVAKAAITARARQHS